MEIIDFWKTIFNITGKKKKTSKKIKKRTKKKPQTKTKKKTSKKSKKTPKKKTQAKKPRKIVKKKTPKKPRKKKPKKKVKKTVQKKTGKKTQKKPSPKKSKKASKSFRKEQKKPKEKEIGVITHCFGKISVGIIKLKGPLAVGDKIHIKGAHDDFTQVVKSIQVNHNDISSAKKGAEVGIKITQDVHENDIVYKVD